MQDKAVYYVGGCVSYSPPRSFSFQHCPSPRSKEGRSETKLEVNCIYTGQQCYYSHYERETKLDTEAWIRARAVCSCAFRDLTGCHIGS